MGNLIYRQSNVPPLDSEYMWSLANHLWQKKEYFHWGRRPLERRWEECDDAYFCYRELPDTEGMPWIDRSDFGETDIFDGVNNMAIRLTLAMMPKDESWLTVTSRQDDSAQLVKSIQQQQVWMHRKAKTRRSFSRHLKQLIVRGTSGIFWHWDTVTRMERLSTPSSRKALRSYAIEAGVPQKSINSIGRVRIPHTTFNGPVIRVVDALDIFLDPEADLLCDRNPTYILQTYRRLDDLQNEEDAAGQKVYGNLEGIVPHRAEDIYYKDTDGYRRLRSLNTMGIFPQNSATRATRLVPVYIIYMPYIKWQDEEYWDTYFHVALDQGGNRPRMIRVEENPSNAGHRFLITDNYIDFYGNVAYGLGAVEKLLSAYRQKNVLSAIGLNAAVSSIMPAYLMASGHIKDDQGINLAPGAINEIAMGTLGLDFIKPVPVPDQQGNQLALEIQRWMGQKIADGFSTLGSYSDDASKQMPTRETATSVNLRATSGNLAIDEQAEKFGETLQELCQGFYDMARQMMQGDTNKDGDLEFGMQQSGGQMSTGVIKFSDFDKDRTIEVLGLHGVVNKAQEIQNLRDSLQVVAQAAPALPNAPLLVQSLAKQLLDRLVVPTPPEAWLSPTEMAAQNPQVLQTAMQMIVTHPGLQQQLMQGMQQNANQQGQGGNGKPQGSNTAKPSGGIPQGDGVRPAQGQSGP